MNIIPVPFRSQKTVYFCGPAVLQMLAAYVGIRKDQRVLARSCGTNKETGTDRAPLIREARKLGYRCTEHRQATLARLLRVVRAGTPAIVNFIEPDGDIGHYALAVGADGRSLVLHDPWNGARYRIGHKEFVGRWRGDDSRSKPRWFVACYPKFLGTAEQKKTRRGSPGRSRTGQAG